MEVVEVVEVMEAVEVVLPHTSNLLTSINYI